MRFNFSSDCCSCCISGGALLQLCCAPVSGLTLKAYILSDFLSQNNFESWSLTIQNCDPGSGRRTPVLKFVKNSSWFRSSACGPRQGHGHLDLRKYIIGTLRPSTPHFTLQIFLIPITRPGTNLSLFTLSLGMCDVCVCVCVCVCVRVYVCLPSSYLMNFKNSVQRGVCVCVLAYIQ